MVKNRGFINLLIPLGVLLIFLFFLLAVFGPDLTSKLGELAKRKIQQITRAISQDEAKEETEPPEHDIIPNQLLVKFKAGVNQEAKGQIFTSHNLKKGQQAPGTENYDVQVVTVDPKKAKQTIGALSKNKRIESVDFIRIPDAGGPSVEPPKVKGLRFIQPAYAQTPSEILVTPEGVRIESYTNLVTASQVADVLRANAESLSEIGSRLTVSIDEYADAGSGYASYSAGTWSFSARIKLVADSYVLAPNRNMGHEYGHVHGWYYRWKLWGSSWNSYLQARNLLGDPRLGSNYAWRVEEIFAEDYRQLLASPQAWQESPNQFNSEIALASQVPGLSKFLCEAWVGKVGNDWFRCNPGSDTAPPSVSITSPVAGSTVSGLVDVTISATDNIGVTKTELYADGALYGTDLTSPFVFSWDTTNVANGSHTLSAKAYDAADNTTSSASVTVTVSNTSTDTQPPIVSITSPSDGQTVSGTITVEATATDNVGVAKTEFYVDESLKGTDTSSLYSFNLDTKSLSNGDHNFEVRAYDAVGNVGYSGVVTVNVNNNNADTTPPAVAVTSPTDGSTLESKGPTKIQVSASDDGAVTKVEIYIDDTLKSTLNSSPYNYNWNPRKYLSGTHLITAKAYDAAANSASASVAVIK